VNLGLLLASTVWHRELVQHQATIEKMIKTYDKKVSSDLFTIVANFILRQVSTRQPNVILPTGWDEAIDLGPKAIVGLLKQLEEQFEEDCWYFITEYHDAELQNIKSVHLVFDVIVESDIERYVNYREGSSPYWQGYWDGKRFIADCLSLSQSSV
jgi:hypothetical protein